MKMLKTNKKISLLISSLSGGGAENVCVNIANGLAENGWLVDLVVLDNNNAVYLERINSKVNIIVLNVRHTRHAALPLLKYLKKQKIEKILIFSYELSVLAIMLRFFFKLEIKIISRNINTFSKNTGEEYSLWRRYIVKPLINYFYCKNDFIINQCQAMKDDLINVFPELLNKTYVIYNPVSEHIEKYASTHELTTENKQDYLLCIGRLEKQKAFHYAIEAFAKLKETYPTLRLKLVGQGSLESELKQQAIDLGIETEVDFEGFQKNTIPFYLNAKATLLTSLYEGFPNVLIESITLGTPVIAFDCPSGPHEIIQPKLNGHLVKYKCVNSLVEACDDLLSNGIGMESIISTAKSYSTKVIIKKYSDFLASK
ncbi:glycosyltransferase [Providencia rettgeri]|uniref:glycosyltransferase n=1 Tax=Providencia sp. PROV069 TaxID=2949795 RepID=UPI00234ADC2F|nr:glycosyltransferase [Providencia sp. PROV069]